MAAVKTPDGVAGDQVAGRQPPAEDDGAGRMSAVSLSRIAWLATVAIAVLTGVIVLLNGYTGYGILSFVVGASAAINLR